MLNFQFHNKITIFFTFGAPSMHFALQSPVFYTPSTYFAGRGTFFHRKTEQFTIIHRSHSRPGHDPEEQFPKNRKQEERESSKRKEVRERETQKGCKNIERKKRISNHSSHRTRTSTCIWSHNAFL